MGYCMGLVPLKTLILMDADTRGQLRRSVGVWHVRGSVASGGASSASAALVFRGAEGSEEL